ncbi:MAG: hypothetical protein AB7H93_06245 [Vicinamibacterales bacterium]
MPKRCGTLLLAVTVSLGAGCRDAAAPGTRAAPSEAVWRAVGTWSGRGDRQTDSFDVTTGALKLRWQARETTPGAGRLRVSLHSAISGRPLQTILDVRGGGDAAVFAEDEPRVSYLVIESDGVEWALDLHEASAGPVEGR